MSSALKPTSGRHEVALAAGVAELPYACRLATVQLLTDGLAVDRLLPVDGELPVTAPRLDPGAAVERLAAAPTRVDH